MTLIYNESRYFCLNSRTTSALYGIIDYKKLRIISNLLVKANATRLVIVDL